MDDFTIILLHVLQNKSFRNDRNFLREGSPLHEGGTSRSAPISRYRFLPDRFPTFAGWVPSHSFSHFPVKICPLWHHARWSTKRAHKRSPVFGVHGLKRPPLAVSMVSSSSSFLSSWLGPWPWSLAVRKCGTIGQVCLAPWLNLVFHSFGMLPSTTRACRRYIIKTIFFWTPGITYQKMTPAILS